MDLTLFIQNLTKTAEGKSNMGTIDMTTATFTCHQEDDFAVITILENAKIVTTTVGGKEDMLKAMDMINSAQQIKGVAVLYSDKYRGDAEYKKFLIPDFA